MQATGDNMTYEAVSSLKDPTMYLEALFKGYKDLEDPGDTSKVLSGKWQSWD